MARRRRPPQSQAPRSYPRDIRHIATGLTHEALSPEVFLDRPVPGFISSVRSNLHQFEDRRILLDDAPARSTRRVSRVSLRPASRNRASRIWSAMHFLYPKFTLICVRRRIRRQVLFAFGRGGGGKRRPRWNNYSSVRC